MGAFPYKNLNFLWTWGFHIQFNLLLSNWIPSCMYMDLDPSFIVHWSLLSVLFCSFVSLVSIALLWVHFHTKIWFFFFLGGNGGFLIQFHQILSNWIPSCEYMNLDASFIVHWPLLFVVYAPLSHYGWMSI